MHNKCPYDSKVICAYRDPNNANQITYECDDCPHYIPGGNPKHDPIEGWKAIGCLFIALAIIIAVLAGAGFLIHYLR